MLEILHEDNSDEPVRVNGRVVKNLTAEEYAETYQTGTVHGKDLPDTDLPEVLG